MEIVSEVNTIGWAPFGSAGTMTTLSLHTEDDPARLPTAAVGDGHNPSGRYVVAAGRAGEEDGLCQVITSGALQPRVTYRVAGWVSVVEEGSHPVRVSVRVNENEGSSVLDAGAVCAEAGKWTEIKGAFRLRESPMSADVYVHGAPAGVELKVMDLRIIATDHKARFAQLKEKTDKVRKRDVVLSFGGAALGAELSSGASVRVVQLDNGFPLGTCINGNVIQDPAFVDFFTNHMDWAVFENELKWYWTEAQRGQLNYNDADHLLDFCDRLGKPVRGHCIFWAVDGAVQQWIKDIGGDRDQLMSVVQDRLRSLLSRYAGRFPHYDVNNEMLHGRFYRDRLGEDVSSLMFREAARLDPGAALFVNDYNVECANDPNATPEKYMVLIDELRRGGAQVGGIGLQGHVSNPVGEVICDAPPLTCPSGSPSSTSASKMRGSVLMTSRSCSARRTRTRQSRASSSGGLCRDTCGARMPPSSMPMALSMKQDKVAVRHSRGRIDAEGQFKFRGFHGTYIVQLTTPTGTKMLKTFTIGKGDATLVLDMENL
ncbi:hypothetical protein PR202_ga17147 [Eleusine coracana subsp. coracana]|uniref:GH10 domain-containing protein n=1 Tax=Eleusine coracana subsp. coracana TaxID=191504 RepID=A0AAV5CPS6_ELECO|nr:hypothetical protein PR202_ga17147 [Eleusine coracana subsp. coracana]